MWKTALWFVLLALPSPFMAIEWTRMWESDFYGYLPFLMVTFVGLFTIRWDRVVRMPQRRSSQILIAASITALCFSALQFSPWLGSASWILMVGAFLLAQSGKVIDENMALSPLSFLYTGGKSSVALLWPLTWIALPLPRNYDQWLVAKVDTTSLKVGSYFLDLLQLPHRISTDVIELRDYQILVEQIHWGIQSTYVLIFVAMMIVGVFGRSPWLAPIYLATAVFWSVLMNSIRVVLTVSVRAWYGWDWTTGWQHAALNLFALTFVILCLLSSDRLFKVIFYPTKPDRLVSKPNPIVSLWNRMFWRYSPQAGLTNNNPSLQQ